jgi:hypothetical protein
LHLLDTGAHFSIDNLTFAPSISVPEPMTLSLVGLALLGVAASRRKA